MNLHEFQGKQLFREYGLPVSKGFAVTSPSDAVEAAKKIGGSAVVLNAVEANLDGRNEQAKIIKNCLRGRGYKVLN